MEERNTIELTIIEIFAVANKNIGDLSGYKVP